MAWLTLLLVVALPLLMVAVHIAAPSVCFMVARLRGHADGTPHVFTEVPLGRHACEPMSYCHHYREHCTCGTERVRGYAVEEVR